MQQAKQHLSRHEAAITGEKIFLRTLLPDDASDVYASWLNDPVANKYLETRSVTVPELMEYIQKRYESEEAVFFGIFWNDPASQNDKASSNDFAATRFLHIGNVKLEPVNFEKGTARMGILIGNKEYWGCGVGTETTRLITDYAFEELGLKSVQLGVIAENKAAIHVYEKCGYKIDSVKKDGVNHDGVLYDKVCMVKHYTPVS